MADLGPTSPRARARMVARLQERGINDKAVLRAMEKIERHRFLIAATAHMAYEDAAVPIGHGQTISHPYSVARFVSVARNGKTPELVLDVGSGCGYQAAVWSLLAQKVHSVERIPELMSLARANLRASAIGNVEVRLADAWALKDLPYRYDVIALAACADEIPWHLGALLKEGGRMVMPALRVAEFAQADDAIGEQYLTVVDKTEGELTLNQLEPVKFVPLLRELA